MSQCFPPKARIKRTARHTPSTSGVSKPGFLCLFISKSNAKAVVRGSPTWGAGQSSLNPPARFTYAASAKLPCSVTLRRWNEPWPPKSKPCRGRRQGSEIVIGWRLLTPREIRSFRVNFSRSAGIFAVVCTSKDGSAAVIFGLKTQAGLLILDFTTGFYDAYLFLSVAVRLFELSAMIPLSVQMETRALQFGVRDINPAIYCSASLAAQASGVTVSGSNVCDIRNLPECDLDAMIPAAVRHIGAGRVQLSTLAYDKGRSSPLGGALDYRPGVVLDEDALRSAATWAICASFETSAAVRRLSA